MLLIKIYNTTGLNEVADYNYVVAANSDVLVTETIKGHIREEGWLTLVEKIVQQEKLDNSAISIDTVNVNSEMSWRSLAEVLPDGQ